ncbi:MAG TPA: lipid-binding SYLF domain-containing protein [Candidatus Eisenbacteria bacterium]|nr:lipid-binding SYLF domain-containing protein [Candidatus Eisenbacteria bacterium]
MRSGSVMLGVLVTAVALVYLSRTPVRAEDNVTERVNRAREVYQELVATPDRSIPEQLLKNAKCIAIFPHVIKGAFIIGARHGKGVVMSRDAKGGWSPPAFFTLTGGSWGWQVGAEASDVVLFFMTERGAKSLLESKFTLGGKMGVSAGPVGRTAEASTDAQLNAEIYSYAKSKGLFAGISLEGARMAPDEESIERFYGEKVSARAILFEHKAPRKPAEVGKLLSVLP